ncbi:hypothetical protein Taro_049508 [Colocasia esculenta]|uniref:Uncharacterized protein n=1 Tax=Colocasia esculenta TaxID=4460 RepID=A0A843XBA2_COLES|nr:hypothetical protein [Colocasia esculenta]
MARTTPSAEANALAQPFLFGLALLAAWVASVVAIVALLCGTRSQKSSTPKAQSQPASTHHSRADQTKAATEAATVQQMEAASPKSESESVSTMQPLPPPPAAVAKQHEEEALPVLAGFHGPLPGEGRLEGRAGPRRGMSMNLSMSMKLPEGLTRIRTGRKEHKEDSIWMKTIIMGEKCRVPDEDEEGSVVRDEKGNPRRSYRQRTPRSLPLSRSNSFTDKESVTPGGK